MGSPIIGSVRLFLFLVWTLLLIPLQALAVALRSPLRQRIPLLYHRGCVHLIGFSVVVRGERARERPTLFVSNHSSYLDVTVLGALIPGSFVAKSEVAGWPLFGLLARLQETVFVERGAPRTTSRQAVDLKTRLRTGDNVILFPEGTSSDGNRTLPFKTALFAVAALEVDGQALTVQPVSIAATRLDGIPMGIAFRPSYAWYGDMDLVPHLWNAFAGGRITVEVEFHPPVTLAAFSCRKALADHCWREVAGGVTRAVSGRPRPIPPRSASTPPSEASPPPSAPPSPPPSPAPLLAAS